MHGSGDAPLKNAPTLLESTRSRRREDAEVQDKAQEKAAQPKSPLPEAARSSARASSHRLVVRHTFLDVMHDGDDGEECQPQRTPRASTDSALDGARGSADLVEYVPGAGHSRTVTPVGSDSEGEPAATPAGYAEGLASDVVDTPTPRPAIARGAGYALNFDRFCSDSSPSGEADVRGLESSVSRSTAGADVGGVGRSMSQSSSLDVRGVERLASPSSVGDDVRGVEHTLSQSSVGEVGVDRLVSSATLSSAGCESTRSTSSQKRTDRRTTLMLRNLPNNYTRAMFFDMLDSHGFQGAYDFIYLPMDFSRGCGLGYAFVNMADPASVPAFQATFDGFSHWVLPSSKVCQVSFSDRDQGLKANVRRYRNSPVMHPSVSDDFKPCLFADGVRTAFPAPNRPLRRPSKKV